MWLRDRCGDRNGLRRGYASGDVPGRDHHGAQSYGVGHYGNDLRRRKPWLRNQMYYSSRRCISCGRYGCSWDRDRSVPRNMWVCPGGYYAQYRADSLSWDDRYGTCDCGDNGAEAWPLTILVTVSERKTREPPAWATLLFFVCQKYHRLCEPLCDEITPQFSKEPGGINRSRYWCTQSTV